MCPTHHSPTGLFFNVTMSHCTSGIDSLTSRRSGPFGPPSSRHGMSSSIKPTTLCDLSDPMVSVDPNHALPNYLESSTSVDRESTTSHPARRESHLTDFCIWSCALAQYQPLRGSSTFGLEGSPEHSSRSIEPYIPLRLRTTRRSTLPHGTIRLILDLSLIGPPVALDTRLTPTGPQKCLSISDGPTLNCSSNAG